ncbi:hypothetical protein GGX14DRAFT_391900 [Mycena pura]|uniref:Uncharacterized protein n=1 Tax=Mycena pura TaxID=153505 RepID=A0AAD6YDK3_9AGAR|nr:hypothetical protein GGX14DRAFT_391900 [Mycena pura]
MPHRPGRRICQCKPTCGKVLAARTRREHYEAAPSASSRPSLSTPILPSIPNNIPIEEELFLSPSSHIDPTLAHIAAASTYDSDHDAACSDMMDSTSGSSAAESGHEMDVDSTAPEQIEPSPLAENPHPLPTDVDIEPWSGFDEFLDVDTPVSLEEMVKQLDEMMGPDNEAELWDVRNHVLTEQDRDNIRAFKLKMVSKMPRTAYKFMVYAFNHKMDLSSEWVMLHRVAILSRVIPDWYDCCVDSCAAFTGTFSERTVVVVVVVLHGTVPLRNAGFQELSRCTKH